MIIIAGYTRTDAEKRDGAVEAFRGMVERARVYDGCLDFSISADAVDPERVNLFECWRDQATLDSWHTLKDIGRINTEHQEALCASLDSAEREQLAGLLQRIASQQGLRAGVHPGFSRLGRKGRA